MTSYTQHVRQKKFVEARQSQWPSDEQDDD